MLQRLVRGHDDQRGYRREPRQRFDFRLRQKGGRRHGPTNRSADGGRQASVLGEEEDGTKNIQPASHPCLSTSICHEEKAKTLTHISEIEEKKKKGTITKREEKSAGRDPRGCVGRRGLAKDRARLNIYIHVYTCICICAKRFRSVCLGYFSIERPRKHELLHCSS